MKAVVLVGGEGTRLRPLTHTIPKQMLPLVEITMLERVLAGLASHGVTEAVLSLGYRPDAFIRAFPEGRAAGVRVAYAVEPEPLDTAGAIRFAADHAGIEERFVVLNGDVLTDLDLGALIRFHDDCDAVATISLTPVEDPSAFGVVATDSDGRVVEFVEKPPRGSAPTNLINAGTYVLEPKVLEHIVPGRRTSVEREIFPELARTGRLFAMADGKYWLDAGTPAAYLRANRDILAGRYASLGGLGAREVKSGIWVAPSANVDGEVLPESFIGEAAEVAEHACITGSVLGSRSRAGAGAKVSSSVILSGVVLGASVTVTDSIVGAGAVLEEGCTVSGMSVIGFGARIAAGAHVEGERVPASVTITETSGVEGSDASDVAELFGSVRRIS